jgi:hypothetical protein
MWRSILGRCNRKRHRRLGWRFDSTARWDCWKPTIEIETGIILDWPKGAEASIHYKVCDDGVYRLLDEEKKTVVEIDGYVPDIMSPKENGYGDYVIMDVCTNGKIQNWKPSFDEFTRRAEG